MYDNSPDGHFILDGHPRYANVTIACGFSGHGFKFAPLTGRVLAELVVRGRVKEIRGRKVVVEAAVYAGELLTARGEVVAVQMPESFVSGNS